MRVLVTGVKGQLGHDVVNEMEKRGLTPIGVDLAEMDITDKEACDRVITEANVEAVIHCAAYTAVDAAEDNIEVCRKVNAGGTRNIAEVCKKLGIKMMYISTDYVFDGQGTRPWEPDDERHPLNVYGQTKYEGELAVEELVEKFFTVRIAWVFGVNGKNFIKTMLRIGKERGAASVVDDQIGSPTYTYDLARLLVDMIQTDIRTTAQDSYIGKYANSYDNKCLLVTAIKGYLVGLEQSGILQAGSSSVGIDLARQEAYLQSVGTDTSKMSQQEIKEANTADKVFLEASIKILDAIEDISLNITI